MQVPRESRDPGPPPTSNGVTFLLEPHVRAHSTPGRTPTCTSRPAAASQRPTRSSATGQGWPASVGRAMTSDIDELDRFSRTAVESDPRSGGMPLHRQPPSRRARAGFSLVELMVIIAILLGLLSGAIVFVSFQALLAAHGAELGRTRAGRHAARARAPTPSARNAEFRDRVLPRGGRRPPARLPRRRPPSAPRARADWPRRIEERAHDCARLARAALNRSSSCVDHRQRRSPAIHRRPGRRQLRPRSGAASDHLHHARRSTPWATWARSYTIEVLALTGLIRFHDERVPAGVSGRAQRLPTEARSKGAQARGLHTGSRWP